MGISVPSHEKLLNKSLFNCFEFEAITLKDSRRLYISTSKSGDIRKAVEKPLRSLRLRVKIFELIAR